MDLISVVGARRHIQDIEGAGFTKRVGIASTGLEIFGHSQVCLFLQSCGGCSIEQVRSVYEILEE